MNEKGIRLDILGDYKPQVVYRFLTEELFEHETDDMLLPGWTKNFIYEEFHPKNPMDIEKTAREFIRTWFDKQFNDYYIDFANEMVMAGGQVFTRGQAMEKVNDCLASYTSFLNEEWTIINIHFPWDEKEAKGMGHAEGFICYDAVLENNEAVQIEDPFKLYLSNDDGYWHIFYLVFPGFSW